jgi:cyclic pyranopterin phosphate synthase
MQMSHIDGNGNAQMVDISDKEETVREAVAVGKVYMKPETLQIIVKGEVPKGDVFSTARIAGIMAAKRTQDLIPMCHNIPLNVVSVSFSIDTDKNCVDIKACVKCKWKTGVEMEALTTVSVAALTVYDMCKAVDKSMTISDIYLLSKKGGKSGTYMRKI